MARPPPAHHPALDQTNAGKSVGPHIVTAGPILTAPGGHPADSINEDNRYIVQHATRRGAGVSLHSYPLQNSACQFSFQSGRFVSCTSP